MNATMYMRRCLELAEMAALAGDTPVGALIVCGDNVVGEGVERSRAMLDPSAHAEVEAIRRACQHLETLDLRGCSLYSTVEPCVLCGYAIRRPLCGEGSPRPHALQRGGGAGLLAGMTLHVTSHVS